MSFADAAETAMLEATGGIDDDGDAFAAVGSHRGATVIPNLRGGA